MIAKKTKSADLEKKRFAFFQIGLIIVGSATLVAFEYSSAVAAEKIVQFDTTGPLMSDDFLTDYVQPEKPQPVEQVAQPIQQLEEIIIEPDDKDIKEADFTLIDEEIIPGKDIIDEVFTLAVEPPVDFAEVEPMFPGGDPEMVKFISEKTVYPEMAKEMGIQGTVYVGFIVNTDGSIVDVHTKNDIDKELSREAIRVVSMMPYWTPGEQAGKKVRVRYVVPINFVIKGL